MQEKKRGRTHSRWLLPAALVLAGAAWFENFTLSTSTVTAALCPPGTRRKTDPKPPAPVPLRSAAGGVFRASDRADLRSARQAL